MSIPELTNESSSSTENPNGDPPKVIPIEVRLADDTQVGSHNVEFHRPESGYFHAQGKTFIVHRASPDDRFCIITNEDPIPGYCLKPQTE